MWTYLHIGMYKTIQWPYQHYSRSVIVISVRKKTQHMVILETLGFFGSFRDLWGIIVKIVPLNNKIY